jgi:hypothetical protein
MQGTPDNTTSWLNFAQLPREQGGLGLAPHQAAGLVGNLVNESGQSITPWGVTGDNGTAQGAAQWRGDRLTELQRLHPNDYQTTQAQQAFMRHEFDGSENSAYRALLSAKTPEDAAAAVNRLYERSADTTDHRAKSARQFYSQLTGSPSDGPTAIQQAMGINNQRGSGNAMAFADDGTTGALSTDNTMGPGVLIPGNRAARQSGGLENGLMGAAAALASVYSPQQGAMLAGLRKDPADQGYTLHVDPKTGVGLRMSKDGQVMRFQAFQPTTDPKDDPYRVARDKANSDLFDQIDKDAGSSRSQLQNITMLKSLLANPDVYQGTNGEAVASLKKLASGIPGLNIQGVADTDVAKSIMNQMTLGMRQYAGGMPGSLSDKDIAFLKAMPPSLNNNPEANSKLLDMFGRVQQRSVDMQKRRDDYVKLHGRLDDGFRRETADWANANPLFGDQDAIAPAPQKGNRPPLSNIFK